MTSILQIPCPKDITDEQLEALQESGDASHYRVPLSLGEPHSVTDNSKCIQYIHVHVYRSYLQCT